MGKRTRLAAEQRKKEPRKVYRRLRIPWIPILVVGALAVGAYFLLDSFGVFSAAGARVSDLGRTHIAEGQTFEYNSRPATSGSHWPAPARWGVYSSPLPDERTVHNLEHGGVIIAYNGISKEDIDKLSRLRNGYPRGRWPEVKIVLEPYDRIPPGTIALAAWGWLDTMQGYDEARILAFLRAHYDKCCEPVP